MYNKGLTSTILRLAGTEQGRNSANKMFKDLKSEHFDLMAAFAGIPPELKDLYKSIMAGNLDPLHKLTEELPDWFRSGDIIMMAGNSISSKILLETQKRYYKETRSSHIALIQADFIAVDAMPKLGVTTRLISDILNDAKDDWRIIRLRNLNSQNYEAIQKASTYYFLQPYLIFPGKKPSKKSSYCSELARKIYEHSGINKTGIPKSLIIKPCDFDKLADRSKNWEDVTNQLRPAVEMVRNISPVLSRFNMQYTNGLHLNKDRFEDRKNQRIKIRKLQKQGEIPESMANKYITLLKDADKKMNNTFWDSQKNK